MSTGKTKEDIAREITQHLEVVQAIENAHSVLVGVAKAEHAEKISPGMLITHDMCSCGFHTGTGKTQKCRDLQVLENLTLAYYNAIDALRLELNSND